ncbi:hypothetical protein [Thermomonospora umbrina]|uniref:DivIVA domain-containing protein n=1 Tax=Thermomonospora umbrina TaxID=111806 RepID=A0A3D9SSH2_9ACTN|nr:hypothetical protein [Thermomonospora umbrina]REE95915.1 hypothetical protein DFJ69_1329 [Thermomonospora umbrina]
MLVACVVAGVAVLAGVVAVAMGRGGELSETHSDHPPLQMPTGRRLTGPDVALLHLPHGLWGYQTDVADEALHRLAYALSERDARVAALEDQVAELHRRLDRGSGHDEPANGGPVWDDADATPWDEAADDEYVDEFTDGPVDGRADASGAESRGAG